MKILLSLLMLVTLNACAPFAELQKRPADFQGETAKSPDIFIACALPKIINLWELARVVPDGDKRIIIVSHGAGLGAALTLSATPQATGSHIEFRQMTSLRTFTTEWELAKSCL